MDSHPASPAASAPGVPDDAGTAAQRATYYLRGPAMALSTAVAATLAREAAVRGRVKRPLVLAVLVLVALVTLGLACAGGSDQEAVDRLAAAAEASAAFDADELRRLGFFDTGAVFRAPDWEFESLVRAGLTVVRVPGGTRFVDGNGWAPSELTFRTHGLRRLAAEFDGRPYYMSLYVRDWEDPRAANAPEFEWRSDDEEIEIVSEADSVTIMLQVYSGTSAAWVSGLPPPANPDGGWHQTVVDRRGHLWINPRPEAAVAIDTGEAVAVSGMQELDWWVDRPPDMITLCGLGETCSVTSKGGLRIPSPPSGDVVCAPHPDGFGLLFAVERDGLVLEFNVRQEGRSCNELVVVNADGPFLEFNVEREGRRSSEDSARRERVGTPVRAFVVGASESESGRPVDVVSSADGRLFAGDATVQLSCPPCVFGP